MVTLKALRSEREKVLDALKLIDAKATKEKRNLTAAEQKQWDELEEDLKAFDSQIEEEVNERDIKIDKILGMETKVKKEEYRWINQANGKEVRVLRPDQALYIPTEEEKGLSLGRALRALAIGDFKGAEAEQRLMTTAGSASVKIPTVLSSQLIELARNKSVVFSAGVRLVDMPHGNLTLAKETDTEQLTAQYKAEGDPFAYQNISFTSMTLQAHTMGCMIKLSAELAQDASNISQLIVNRLAQAMADELDRAFISGLGTAADPFTGILNLAGTQTVVGGTVADAKYGPLVRAKANAMKVNAEPNAYIINPDIWASYQMLMTTDGEYIQKPAGLAGLSELVSNRLPYDATNGATLVMGDFTKAFFGVTQGLTIETSSTAGEVFANNEIAFRVVWRGDLAYEKADHFTKITGMI